MTRIKICGLTRLSDVMAAIDLGADALGFNFYPRSPRYISVREAARVIEKLPPFITKVGVIVNFGSARDIRRLKAVLGLDVMQLHGEEPLSLIRRLEARAIIKAVRVTEDFKAAAVKDYSVAAILLDGFTPGKFGGTGKTFEWKIAQQVGRFHRVILSGGLNASNVERAIVEASPYAVDVASGVENAPGKKDFRKMRAFIAAVRRADVRRRLDEE